MKDQRGFSVVELLTVCVIVFIVTIAAFPIVLKTLSYSKEKLYQQNVKEIERISLSWAMDHADYLPDSSKDARFVTLQELSKQAYIKTEDIEDPRDKSQMKGCIVIKKTQHEQYAAHYTSDPCSQAMKPYQPKIQTTSKYEKTLEVNSAAGYETPILKATSILGENLEVYGPTILRNGKVVSQITGEQVDDIYTLVYTAKDTKNGTKATKEIEVKVVDTKAPVITLNGQTKGYTEDLPLGSDYTIPEVTVTDNSKKKISLQITTDLNTKVVGSYEILYQATDQDGNTSVFLVKINVNSDQLRSENQIIVDNAKVLPGDGKIKKLSSFEYYFAGSNPNNYFKFHNEMWRIIGLDPIGLKVIKETPVGQMAWDEKNRTTLKDASILSYLNNNYYQTFSSEEKQWINTKVVWKLGNVDFYNTSKNLTQLQQEEKSLVSDTEVLVGLPDVSDYVKASLDQNCQMNGENCGQQNYLNYNDFSWTFHTTLDKMKIAVFGKQSLAAIHPNDTSISIRPVLYLKGYKTLSGTGSQTDPYRLIG